MDKINALAFQVRDEFRMDFDHGRGGLGRVFQIAGAMDIGEYPAYVYILIDGGKF